MAEQMAEWTLNKLCQPLYEEVSPNHTFIWSLQTNFLQGLGTSWQYA